MKKIKFLLCFGILIISQTACNTTTDDVVTEDLINPKINEGTDYDFTIALGEVEHVGGGRHVRPGTQLRLDTYLTNLGTDASPGRTPTSTGYLVAWYLSTDTVITTDDIRIGSFSGNSLNPRETWRFWSDVLIPENIEGGWYYWGAIIDYTNLVDETNESNNTASGDRVIIN
ncbi:CARDB domain-containing protein [Kordia zhangzhouensis]|uniref:CARDB domain-containing protein n=1 Tax=Kordia zhangzhouensis TaxID=1620405 RepID=UPI000629849C|nr:CARDB domain-containing protein [Kordia zhangzhouensis]